MSLLLCFYAVKILLKLAKGTHTPKNIEFRNVEESSETIIKTYIRHLTTLSGVRVVFRAHRNGSLGSKQKLLVPYSRNHYIIASCRKQNIGFEIAFQISYQSFANCVQPQLPV